MAAPLRVEEIEREIIGGQLKYNNIDAWYERLGTKQQLNLLYGLCNRLNHEELLLMSKALGPNIKYYLKDRSLRAYGAVSGASLRADNEGFAKSEYRMGMRSLSPTLKKKIFQSKKKKAISELPEEILPCFLELGGTNSNSNGINITGPKKSVSGSQGNVMETATRSASVMSMTSSGSVSGSSLIASIISEKLQNVSGAGDDDESELGVSSSNLHPQHYQWKRAGRTDKTASRSLDNYLRNLDVVAISGRRAPPFRRVGNGNGLFMLQAGPEEGARGQASYPKSSSNKRLSRETVESKINGLVNRRQTLDNYDSEDGCPSRSSTPSGRIGWGSSTRPPSSTSNRGGNHKGTRVSSAGSHRGEGRPASADKGQYSYPATPKPLELNFDYHDWTEMMSSSLDVHSKNKLKGNGTIPRVSTVGSSRSLTKSPNFSREGGSARPKSSSSAVSRLRGKGSPPASRSSSRVSDRPVSSHRSSRRFRATSPRYQKRRHSPRPMSGSRCSTPSSFYSSYTAMSTSDSDSSPLSSPENGRKAYGFGRSSSPTSTCASSGRVKSASSTRSRCLSRCSKKSFRKASPPRHVRAHNTPLEVIELIKDLCNSFIEWKSHRKIVLIIKLIRSSKSEVVRYVLHLVENIIFKDFIVELPDNLSALVLSYLPLNGIFKASLVSTQWKAATDANYLWKLKCVQVKWWPTRLLNSHRPLWWKDFYRQRWEWEYYEKLHKDILTKLPHSLAIHILIFLDSPSMLNAALVSHDWALLVKEAKICVKYRHEIEQYAKDEEYRLKCIEKGYATSTDKIQVPWKEYYFRKLRIYKNITNGISHKWTIGTGHSGRVLCVQASSKLVLSGGADGKVKLFRLPGGECIKTIVAHPKPVSCLQFDSVKMVTGSHDCTIKLWDFGANNAKKVLRGHRGKVTCLQFRSRKLASADAEGKVRIWDLFKGESVFSVDAHKAEIRCIYFVGTKLLTGGNDSTIKYIDAHSGNILKTIVSDKPIMTIDFDEFFIYSATGNRLKIWRLDNGSCQSVFPDKSSYQKHLGRINSVILNKTYRKLCISASSDKIVKVWNLNTGKCFRTLEGHAGGINSISMFDNILATAADDGRVRIHDFYADD
eukprot:Nk52_evm39s242 gene=Nk52_evmTU39s242